MPTKISFNKNIINCMHLLVDVVLVVDVDVVVSEVVVVTEVVVVCVPKMPAIEVNSAAIKLKKDV